MAVPHGEDETSVLRSLGIPAPAPIHYYYDWPGRYVPYEHQKTTAAFLTMNKKAIVLNDIGTGKSISAAWAADYLMKIGLVKRALIISPLSTLDRVWADTLFTSFVGRRYVILHGSAAKRKKLLATDHDFGIINHDGMQIIAKVINGLYDLLIVDEAAVLRNPSTDRFKAVYRYMKANPACRLWLMTGTPTPNEPTDAWALARLADSPDLTKTYTGFRDEVMMKIGQWKYVPRPESAAVVAKVLQPSIRFTREECLDLPDTVFHTRVAELSPEQKTLYKKMTKELFIELSQGEITAANEAVKAQKLVQIACGAAYSADGDTIEVPCGPRQRVLKEALEEAGGKAIVFVPLTGVLHMLEKYLTAEGFTVGVIFGDVSQAKRAEIFRDFQNTEHPQILLAHPATMAHGLTLTASSTIVWYAPITSNETYTQANGRIERIGKNKTSNVIHIETTELERRMFERLRNKQKVQGVLLDILGEET